MAWPKGKKRGYRTGGRVKGKPNHATQELREMIRGALDEVGGQQYLVNQARENPKAFLTLVSRLVPTQVQADVNLDKPVEIRVITGFDSGPHER